VTVEQMEFVLHGYFWTESVMCAWEHRYSEEISPVLIKDLVTSFTMLLVRTV